MLKQRIITASILFLIVIGILFFTPLPVFISFVGIILFAAAWEWANLCHIQKQLQRQLYALLVISLGLLGWWVIDRHYLPFLTIKSVFVVSGCWWAIALLWIQGYPSSQVFWQARWVRMSMGPLILLPTWLGLAYLRALPEGAFMVLAVVLIVATADTGAYFSGRMLGKHKLAPRVSPGKSWEGVFGGLIAVSCLCLVFNFFYSEISLINVLLIALPTAMVSVVGDLLESMLKRSRGVKDSSNLLPGHGGVLDRVDGLMAAVPIFTLAVISVGLKW